MTKCRCLALAVGCGVLAAQGALLYEPDSYVQDGLVLQLDGIRNVGALKAHDASAEKWKDLSSRGNAVFFVKRDESDMSAWTDAGFLFVGKAYGKTDHDLPQMANLTFEVFGDFPADKQNAGSSNYPIYITLGEGGKECAAFTQSTWGTLTFKTDNVGGGSGNRPSLSPWDGTGFSCVLGTNESTLWCATNGVWAASTKPRSSQTAANAVPWLLANSGAKDDYLTGDNYTRQAYGTYNAVRIYNRALTAEEVAANRTLDVIRFETGIPVTNAVVATALPGAEGAESCGVYAVNGSHTFSAPVSNVVGAASYYCTGYRLERWDATAGAWGNARFSPARCCTVTVDEKVRITWQWSASGAVRSAATYDVGDYVQDGLAVHFDGIHNSGAVEPHGAAATTWVDLTGNGNDGVCADPSVFSWVGGKGWSVSGDCKPVTVGTGIAKTLATTNFTMEIACTPAAANRRMCYFGQYNWNKGAVNVEHSTAGKLRLYRSANDNDASDWQSGVSVAAGDFTSLAFAVTPALSAIYKDGAPAASTSVPVLGNASPALDSVVGGELMAGSSRAGDAFDPTYKMAFNGTYSAFRLYNRALDAAEIAWNAKVDAVRYGGALTETNVVVVSEYEDYNGTPPGAYEVWGTAYTFTADDARGPDGHYVLSGYTIEEWDGSGWGEKHPYTGSSFTYTAGTSATKVRLTWKWKNGLVIIFR